MIDKTKIVSIKNMKIGGRLPLVLIAGPCVIENEKSTFEIAEELVLLTSRFNVPFIFKASYDKANRTSMNSFRGVGLKKGLKILSKIKRELKVPVVTDVHCKDDVAGVADVADVVQIPAFLCRQTDLLITAAKKAKCINIKKGQFLAPWDMKYVIEKIEKTGSENILISERGTSFGYNRLIADMCSLPILRNFGYPVIFDVTHSLQMPGGQGRSTGGKSEFIPYMARSAVACGCDGVFIEVHPDPKKALSDGPNSLKLNKLPVLLEELIEIDQIIKRYEK